MELKGKEKGTNDVRRKKRRHGGTVEKKRERQDAGKVKGFVGI